jgi:hypothetical protein
MPKVVLHRCPLTFLKTEMDACYKVQKALDEQGIDYEISKEPLSRAAGAPRSSG